MSKGKLIGIAASLSSSSYHQGNIGCLCHDKTVLHDTPRSNIIKMSTTKNFQKRDLFVGVLNGISVSDFQGQRDGNVMPLQQGQLKYFPFSHLCNFQQKHFSDAPTKPPKRHQQKPSKPSVKEFEFKGKIGDHDLDTKLNKIKKLLEKGKTIQVFLRVSNQDSMPLSKFQETLDNSVKLHCKIQKDFTNKFVTRFTLFPIIKKETETPAGQDMDDK